MKIFIYTEDKEINNCDLKGIQSINTGSAPTAIDRVKLFSDQVQADSYINVQGDEPIVNPKDIEKIIQYNKLNPDRVVLGKQKLMKKG